MIISLNTENFYKQIQYAFIMQVMERLGMEGAHLNVINAIYGKYIAHVILNEEKLKQVPTHTRTT